MKLPVPRSFTSLTIPSALIIILIFPLLSSCSSLLAQQTRSANSLPLLEPEAAAWIGQRIFANECNLKLPCLTSWNAGENFPSLGIGHFIWYRADQAEPFVESFPALLAFYRQQGIALPDWLGSAHGSPWPDRSSFLAELDSPRLVELRQFLHDTMPVQIQFIIARLHASLPKLRAASDQPDKVEQLFYRIAHSDTPLGLYALIDYINFKGEGTAVSERYQGEGWGLLQVLEHMLSNGAEGSVMQQFADSAGFVLERRIRTAPPERGEQRWRAGWIKRVNTYRPR